MPNRVCKWAGLVLLVPLSIFSVQRCDATEFIVVQLPHEWVIGADSREGDPSKGPTRTVDKILHSGRFVVLMYGGASLDMDARDEAAVKDKKNQPEAFIALTTLFDQMMRDRIAGHARRKAAGTALADEVFLQDSKMGFVLLSVEDGKPLIDNYEIRSNTAVTDIVPFTNPRLEMARKLYTPAPFPINILSVATMDMVKDSPEFVVKMLLENHPFFSEGIGPPYVVDRFDGKDLKRVCESPAPSSGDACTAPQ